MGTQKLMKFAAVKWINRFQWKRKRSINICREWLLVYYPRHFYGLFTVTNYASQECACIAMFNTSWFISIILLIFQHENSTRFKTSEPHLSNQFSIDLSLCGFNHHHIILYALLCVGIHLILIAIVSTFVRASLIFLFWIVSTWMCVCVCLWEKRNENLKKQLNSKMNFPLWIIISFLCQISCYNVISQSAYEPKEIIIWWRSEN